MRRGSRRCPALAAAVLGLKTFALTPPVTVLQRDAVRSPFEPASVSVSADGRFVAFASQARLSPADTNDVRDVYVLDRETGRATLESIDPAGRVWNAACDMPRLSGDGRIVVFEAVTTYHERDGWLRSRVDIAVRDRVAGTTVPVSIGAAGEPPNGWSRGPSISGDGRFVAFVSTATNLVEGPDANGLGEDVYLFDLFNRRVTRISVDVDGRQLPAGASFAPALSADGRVVAFTSTAALTGAEAAKGRPPSNVFVRDLGAERTERVSGAAVRPNGSSSHAAVSGDGRYVAFESEASNLVDNDRNRASDVFLFDRHGGTLVLVTRSARSGTANAASVHPAISHDGRFVAFQSVASDLECARKCAPVAEDINLIWDVFVFDRRTSTVTRASGDERGAWTEASTGPAIDAAGRVLAFSSLHPIDEADLHHDYDLFVRAR
jgi:Tol biopolymer transport system component